MLRFLHMLFHTLYLRFAMHKGWSHWLNQLSPFLELLLEYWLLHNVAHRVLYMSDRISTHDDPTYTKHGVLHYAVANIPGAVPRTATIGLTNVTIPYALQIANKGYEKACEENEALRKGINTLGGYVTYESVAKAHNLEYKPV